MQNKTAAILIIGDEILSGRTQDLNTQHIAQQLTKIGVDLMEVRIALDNKHMIMHAVKNLYVKYDYLFTTGGIGPTHDDITSSSIAQSLGVPLVLDQTIYNILQEFSDKRGEELNEHRAKMAYIPEGAKLLDNHITLVPGFMIKNIFVMAGIPHVMQDMLGAALNYIEHGKPMKSKNLQAKIGESMIADRLEYIQNKYKNISLGSYPFKEEDGTKEGLHCTSLVIRSNDYAQLDKAHKELQNILKS